MTLSHRVLRVLLFVESAVILVSVVSATVFFSVLIAITGGGDGTPYLLVLFLVGYIAVGILLAYLAVKLTRQRPAYLFGIGATQILLLLQWVGSALQPSGLNVWMLVVGTSFPAVTLCLLVYGWPTTSASATHDASLPEATPGSAEIVSPTDSLQSAGKTIWEKALPWLLGLQAFFDLAALLGGVVLLILALVVLGYARSQGGAAGLLAIPGALGLLIAVLLLAVGLLLGVASAFFVFRVARRRLPYRSLLLFEGVRGALFLFAISQTSWALLWVSSLLALPACGVLVLSRGSSGARTVIAIALVASPLLVVPGRLAYDQVAQKNAVVPGCPSGGPAVDLTISGGTSGHITELCRTDSEKPGHANACHLTTQGGDPVTDEADLSFLMNGVHHEMLITFTVPRAGGTKFQGGYSLPLEALVRPGFGARSGVDGGVVLYNTDRGGQQRDSWNRQDGGTVRFIDAQSGTVDATVDWDSQQTQAAQAKQPIHVTGSWRCAELTTYTTTPG